MTNSKCGEVTFCTQVGKRVYVLNCIYCSQICLQWEMFINHLEQEHNGNLNFEPIIQPETSKMPIKMEIPEIITDEPSASVHINKKQKMLDESLPSSSAFDDPLESENSTSEMCLESSIKVEQEEECLPNLNLFETEDNSSEMVLPPRELGNTVLVAPYTIKEIDACHSCFNIKEHLEDKCQDLKRTIVRQNAAIMKSQAEQKVLIERILFQEVACNNERTLFPLKSVDELYNLNNSITEENRDIYVNIMKLLLKGRLSKTLTDVISTGVCMEVNIDGIQGKKRLKDFAAFYQALTDACRSLGSNEVEKDLKSALKIIKKRLIQKKCITNRKLNKAT